MITKQTVLDQIEITRNDTIQIRIGLELVEDGVIVASKWHRTTVEPGGDVDAQLRAVNVHLVQMNELPVSDADIAKIKAHKI